LAGLRPNGTDRRPGSTRSGSPTRPITTGWRAGHRLNSALDQMRRAACDDTRVTGHRVILKWMGSEVETLADLLPAHPRAVCVGINPAPTSVAVGHYYHGPQGQRFFARLIQATLLQPIRDGFEDDAAVASGIGFTDVVKRPTRELTKSCPTSFATAVSSSNASCPASVVLP
jgi:Uracil DNA glycosylase superfamily